MRKALIDLAEAERNGADSFDDDDPADRPTRAQSRRTLDQLLGIIKSRTDLTALIGETVRLRRADDGHSGACPLHPPYTDETLQVRGRAFECTACGFKGSAIGWLMYTEGLSIEESAMALRERLDERHLPALHPCEIERSEQERQSVLESCVRDWQDALSRCTKASRYLLEQRGLTQEAVDRFGIGWCPMGAHPPGGRTRRLWQAGVLIRRRNGAYVPRFGGRVMLPIRDDQGYVVGFGGRAIDDREPKYLNSAGSRTFSKSTLLYGWHEMLATGRELGQIVLVEGYLDVIGLRQAGILGAVATLGTAVSETHVISILNRVDHLSLCLDADKPGQKATYRTILEVLAHLQEGQRVDVLMMPTGMDPDDVYRTYGSAHMQKLTRQGMPIEDWLFDFVEKTVLSGARRRRDQGSDAVLSLDTANLGTRAKAALTARELVERCAAVDTATRIRERFERALAVPI